MIHLIFNLFFFIHPIYISSTNIIISDENLEIKIKLFRDDLEDGLRDFHGLSISIDNLNKIADDLVLSMLPDKPIETGLIDKLIYPDELNDLLTEKTNQEDDIELADLKRLIMKKKGTILKYVKVSDTSKYPVKVL